MKRAAARAFLERHGLLARKDLGQNFLIDEQLAERLAALAGVEARDSVVEIGTGLGILTRALAARASRVVTLEVDAGLVRALRAEAILPGDVELLHQDVLKADLAGIVRRFDGPVRVVSNLPYSISAPVLRRLLELRELLVDWSVMLQREVGERLLARSGTKAYGSLSVLHQLSVRAQRALDVAPGCFFPTPRVRSTFVRLVPLAAPSLSRGELAQLERVVRAAFASRRKTLVNSLLSAGLAKAATAAELRALLSRLSIDPRARAEALAPEQFLDLARELTETPGCSREA